MGGGGDRRVGEGQNSEAGVLHSKLTPSERCGSREDMPLQRSILRAPFKEVLREASARANSLLNVFFLIWPMI